MMTNGGGFSSTRKRVLVRSSNHRTAFLLCAFLLQPSFFVTPTLSFSQNSISTTRDLRQQRPTNNWFQGSSSGELDIRKTPCNILYSTKSPEDFLLSEEQQQQQQQQPSPIKILKDNTDPLLLTTTTGASYGEPALLSSTNVGALPKKIIIKSSTGKKREKVLQTRKFPRRAVQIYADYATRLWTDTSYEARQRIARDKASAAIRSIESVIRCGGFSDVSDRTKEELLKACKNAMTELTAFRNSNNGQSPPLILPSSSQSALTNNATLATSTIATSLSSSSQQQQQLLPPPQQQQVHDAQNQQQQQRQQQQGQQQQLLLQQLKTAPVVKRKSILFGAMMGAVVACWVFSGNYIFTGLFTLMTIIGQLEYYRAVIGTGVYPARRITILGACSMFLSALFAPELHQICLPLFGLWAMIWFLTMRRQVSTIPEIATTFTGMFYLGYVPSFWVRIRLLSVGHEPTRLAPLVAPFLNFLNTEAERNLPGFIPKSIHLPITTGAVFIFWTWLCLAFSDVGAYFVGRKLGRTKLGKVAPAAGATSPNKTVEGVLGGCAVSAMLGMAGAWVQKWPYWWWTGAVHGMLLGLIGLIGDLTASMLKRDAGLKDFGDLLPDHGGILDRVDSFIWTAPYSWLVCAYVIPALKQFSRTGTMLPL